MEFDRSSELARRLAAIVPGASHTYAKGPDQYPQLSPGVLVRGQGARVWDADGNEFIEYGMGLRSVGLGHSHPEVVSAVRSSLDHGTNFTRPSVLELYCAETLADVVAGAEMVKFTKDGSTATSAALKLARRATGRDKVAISTDSPFFSYDDWFMCTTTAGGGIPESVRSMTVSFDFNDLESIDRMFDEHDGQVAAVFLEAARVVGPCPGFLEGVRQRCDRHGAVLVFDETITGFRYWLGGAPSLYGVAADLSVWGKALANGFSLSALSGRRELMSLGSRASSEDDVFLLSTTHGAETTALSAAMATMGVYQAEPVIQTLYAQGSKLAEGLSELAQRHGLAEFVQPVGFGCNLVYSTLGPDGHPSQAFRTLFLQETIRRGVIMPSLVVSYAHTDVEVEITLDAIDGALSVYERALEDGVESHLVGPPSRYVFDRRWE